MKELTAASARDLQPDTGPDGKPKPSMLKDHVVKGLELHCYPSGLKTWKLYYRAPDGTQRRPKIGEYPTWRVDEAREHAKGWLRERDRGKDPSRERQAYKGSPTVADLSREWLKRCERTDKPRTLEEKQRRAKLYIVPRLGTLKVCDVKLSDIEACLKHVETARVLEWKTKSGETAKRTIGGTTAARHVRSDLSAMFRFAEHDDNRWRPRHSNPVRDTAAYTKRKRRRHMEASEAPKVAAALDALAETWPYRVAALWVILLAGTRVTELVTAKRKWLVGNKIIRPDHKTDASGEDRVIVLPAQALERINKLGDDSSGFLFGRELGDDLKTARYKVFTVWDKARAAAGCPDLRVQDFRRTFASAAKSAGRDLDTVGELFGHTERETIQSYAFLFDEAADKAAQDTADEIEKRMRGNVG
jgi:site-specific recombinase XerD